MNAHTPGPRCRPSCGCDDISLIRCPAHFAAASLLQALGDLLTVTAPALVTEDEAESLGARYGLENGPWSDIVDAVRDAARAAIAEAGRQAAKEIKIGSRGAVTAGHKSLGGGN